MEYTRTDRQLRHQAGQAARRSRNAAKSAKKRAPRISGHGFLNHVFEPFYLFDGNIQRAETEFFRSLQHFCKHYELSLPETVDLSFPQNIYCAWEVTAGRVKAIDPKLNCIILNDEHHEAVLAVTTQYDTGRTLYYLPVKPLSKWVEDDRHTQTAEMVSLIFAYLYQVAQIPMYSAFGTFLYEQYNYVEEMIGEDMNENDAAENGYRQEQLDELYTLKNAGIHIERLIGDKGILDNVEDKVLSYANADECDNELAILAIEFVQLYTAYPDRSIFDAIRPDLYFPEVTERIRAEEYVSFYWSGNDSVIETVMSMIDCSFQEMGITDEPVDVVIFDKLPIGTQESFGFESRFFPLLDRLCTFLNRFDN